MINVGCGLWGGPGGCFRVLSSHHLEATTWSVGCYSEATLRSYNESVLTNNGWCLDDPGCADLLLWLNGLWSEWGQITVYRDQLLESLTAIDPCMSWDLSDEAIADHVTRTLLKTVFACVPPEPICARWTKTFVSCQHYMPGFAVHGIFPIVYCLGFDADFCDKVLMMSAVRAAGAFDGVVVPCDDDPPGGHAPGDGGGADLPAAAAAPAAGASPAADEGGAGGEEAPPAAPAGEGEDLAAPADAAAAAEAAPPAAPDGEGGVPGAPAAADAGAPGAEAACAQASDTFFNEHDADRAAKAAELKSRMKKTSMGFRHPETSWLIKLLTLLLGGFNYITAWFLKRQHERFRRPTQLQVSIVLDIMWAPTSPVTVIRQHIAEMLCLPMSQTPLRVLFAPGTSHGAISEARVQKLHSMLLAGDGSLHIRFEEQMQKGPHFWIPLGDSRRQAEHPGIRRRLATSRRCCHDIGATVPILDMCEHACGPPIDGARDAEYFAGPMVTAIAHTSGRLLDGVCDDLEVRHNRNKDHGNGIPQSNRTLCANSTIRESTTVYDTHATDDAKTVDEAVPESLIEPGDGDSEPTPAATVRKFSGKHILHHMLHRGMGTQLVSETAWERTHAEWDTMSPELQQQYADLADLANDGAELRPTAAVVQLPHEDSTPEPPTRAPVPSPFSPAPFARCALPLNDGRATAVAASDVRATTQTLALQRFDARLIGSLGSLGRTMECIAADGSPSLPLMCKHCHDDHGDNEADPPAPPAPAGAPAGAAPAAHVHPPADAPSAAPPAEAPPVGPPVAAEFDPHARRCQDLGACKDELGPDLWRRFNRMTQSTSRFLRAVGAGHLTTPAICTTLIRLDALGPAPAMPLLKSSIYWIGFANGSPVFQSWLAMPPEGAAAGYAHLTFPFSVKPATVQFVESYLESVREFPSATGRLCQRKSVSVLREAAVDSTVAHWCLTQLQYKARMLTDPEAPPGLLDVLGRDATVQPTLIDVPLRRQAAAKPKPRAKPHAKAAAAPKAAGGGAAAAGRGRRGGRGRGRGRGRGACPGDDSDDGGEAGDADDPVCAGGADGLAGVDAGGICDASPGIMIVDCPDGDADVESINSDEPGLPDLDDELSKAIDECEKDLEDIGHELDGKPAPAPSPVPPMAPTPDVMERPCWVASDGWVPNLYQRQMVVVVVVVVVKLSIVEHWSQEVSKE